MISCKNQFFQFQIRNPEHKYDPATHLIAGGLGGGVASAVTTPLDCIKTVLNTQQTPEIQDKRMLLKATSSYKGNDDKPKPKTPRVKGI